VIQYSGDRVFDIDYFAPYFNPQWINPVHRWGLIYSGSPRRDIVCPHLSVFYPGDEKDINVMWQLYIRHSNRLNTAQHSTLRTAIRIAGQFFEDFHRKVNRVEQFSNLMIALEALYTPPQSGENTFKISQSCSLLTTNPSDYGDREDTFSFLRRMFGHRAKLFHGGYDSHVQRPEEFISDEDIARLCGVVRRSILRFITLFVHGENVLENVRRTLQSAVLNPDTLEKLHEDSDYDSLLRTIEPGGA
jgi:hypothetical protein